MRKKIFIFNLILTMFFNFIPVCAEPNDILEQKESIENEPYKTLEENNLKSKLILQVHDELIIEAYEDELEIVSRIMKDEMENAVHMDVSLDVDLNIGDSWYETK